MAEIRTVHVTRVSAGDAAVSGLLNGLVAGAAMTGYLLVALGIAGESPAEVMSRFGPAGGASSPLVGAVSHVAMSAIYGILFALLWRWLSARFPQTGTALLAGLIYGGALFALATLLLLPVAGSPLLGILLHFGVAHALYGLVLGYLHRPK